MKFLLALLLAAPMFAQTLATFRGPDGVEREYTLQPWPYRIYITPEIYDTIKDPDGAGAGKNALYDAAEGQGLIHAINSARTGSDFLNNYPNTTNNPGVYAEYAAFLYTMCNQCTTTWDSGTTWLQYAKTILLNHYAYSNKKYHGFYTYSDSGSVAWGYNGTSNGSTDADYLGPYPMHAAQAYVLLRDQFTSLERTTIAGYFINGLLPEDLCTLPVERQAGVVSKSGTTYTVTGNTWDGVSVGDLIVVNGYKDSSGNVITTAQCQAGASCNWSWTGKVTAVTDPNTITLYVPSGSYPDFQEGYWFKYSAWNDTLCGYGRTGFSHGDFPPFLEAGGVEGEAQVTTSLPAITWPAPLGGETGIVITVNKSDWAITNVPAPTPSKPWRAFIGGVWWDGEMVEITNISGNNLTITRGKWWHGKAWTCCNPGSPLKIRFVNILGRSYGPSQGLNNRQLTRAQAVLATGLAFCGDDARACTVLQRAADYFQREGYAKAKEYVGMLGHSMGDYQLYRGIYAARMAAFLQNSTLSPAADWTSGRWILDQGYLHSHWVLPWAPKEGIEVGQTKQFGCYAWDQSSNTECANAVGWLNLLFPSDPLTAYSWSFLKDAQGFNLQNGSISSVYGNGASGLSTNVMLTYLWIFAGGHAAWPTAADRTALTNTYIQTHGDSSQPGGTGYLTVGSRTGFGADSSLFWTAGLASSDKLDITVATYGFGKKGWLLYGPLFLGAGRHQKLVEYNTVLFGEATQTTFTNYTLCNYTNFPDGRCPDRPLPAHGNKRANSVWAAIDDQYLFKKPTPPANVPTYWLTNGGQSNYHGLNYHWRNYIHFKPASGRERLLVFDDVSKTVSDKIRVLNHYPQTGELIYLRDNNGGRSYTEGNTRISADFSYVDSRTGTSEGGSVKMVSSYLCAGDATCDDFYDIPLQAENASWPNSAVSVCPNGSSSYPCSVKLGAYTHAFTAPVGSFSYQRSDAASANNNTNARIWAYLDPADSTVKVGWTSQVSIAPTCSGSVSCVGVISGAPAGTLVLFGYRYAQSGSFPFGCSPTFVNGNEAYGPTIVGNCFSKNKNTFSSAYQGRIDNTLPVSMQTNPTACNSAGCRIYTVHEISEDLSITPSTKSEVSVTSDVGVFKGIALDAGGASAAIGVFPIAQVRAIELGFTNPSSTTTHLVVAGLVEGTYRVRCSGVDHQTGISLAQGEAMLEVTNLPGNCVTTVERTAGVTLNISASPGSVSKSCTFGGSNPSNQNVAISASGGTLTNVSQSKVGSATWLTVTPSSLTGVGDFTFSFNCAGLAVNTYTETVRFVSSQSEVTNDPLDVQVTLTVTNPGTPVISRSPTSLTFSAAQGGGNPASQNVAVTVANGPVTVSVADNQPWCSASPTSFSGSGSATNVAVSVTTGALTAGNYECTLTFSAAGAADVTVLATFTVTAPSSITLNLGSVTDFSTTATGNAPAAKPLTFTSPGGALTNFLATPGAAWLTATPSSGTTATELSVSVNPSGLAAGRHCSTISVSSTTPNVANSPVAVPVCLELAPAPIVGLTVGPYLPVGQAVSAGFNVTGGVAAYTWQLVSGTLPTGLSVSGTSGASISIAGTPTQLGDWPITMGVYDVNGAQATQSVVLRVRPQPNQADFGFNVRPVENGAVGRVDLAKLNANDVGTIVVRNSEGTPVKTIALPSGTASRTFWLSDLAPPGPYTVEALLPTGAVDAPGLKAATKTYIPIPVTGATGTLLWRGTPSAGEGIDNVVIYYGTDKASVEAGTSASMTDATCTSAAECYASATVARGGYYVLAEFKAGSTVVRRDPVVSVIPVLR